MTLTLAELIDESEDSTDRKIFLYFNDFYYDVQINSEDTEDMSKINSEDKDAIIIRCPEADEDMSTCKGILYRRLLELDK